MYTKHYFMFIIIFNFQIIYANVTTSNHQPISLDGIQAPLEVEFTYSVSWTPTE